MYVVERNVEPLPYNDCFSWNSISITNSECVFVALGKQHAMRILHIVICDLCGCTIFFHSEESGYRVLVGKPEGKRPLGIPRRR